MPGDCTCPDALGRLFACPTHGPEQERVLREMLEPPHRHEWRVDEVTGDDYEKLEVICTCGQDRTVPNRLPIEVPE